ncbi:L antigen family member 3 [Gorgonomyces haynaldii]|nr:L antigen family member 3 [Gorgonomyces haynaldii]
MHQLELEIPFPSNRLAEIALQVVQVDKEVNVNRELKTRDNVFVIQLETEELKLLRTVVSSLLEHIDLIIQTMDQ